MGIKINFDGAAFSRTYFSRPVIRWLSSFFATLPADVLELCIEHDIYILKYLDPQMIGSYRQAITPYRRLADVFSDEEVYDWLPEGTRGLVESHSNGKTWAMSQLARIRQDFFSA